MGPGVRLGACGGVVVSARLRLGNPFAEFCDGMIVTPLVEVTVDGVVLRFGPMSVEMDASTARLLGLQIGFACQPAAGQAARCGDVLPLAAGRRRRVTALRPVGLSRPDGAA